jgi:hypothetical protein
MGKVLVLPRTPEQIVAVQRAYPAEVYPDFAARLHLWRQRDAERRERFRRDMAMICDLACLRLLVPPGEGA